MPAYLRPTRHPQTFTCLWLFLACTTWVWLATKAQVYSWGSLEQGGYSDNNPYLQQGVADVYASDAAFAARRADGQVHAWGKPARGGASSSGLIPWAAVFPSRAGFGCVSTTGKMITWGDSNLSPPPSLARWVDEGVCQAVAGGNGYAAVRCSGELQSWPLTANSLPKNIAAVYGNSMAFLAVAGDGVVTAWGDPCCGGDASTEPRLEYGIRTVLRRPTASIMLALLGNGEVASLGSQLPFSPPPNLTDVSYIVGNQENNAFVAIHGFGKVVVWGDPEFGGAPSAQTLAALQYEVVKVAATCCSFAALLSSGSVLTWGHSCCGAAGTVVQEGGTCAIYATRYGFAAVSCRGSVTAWGNQYSPPPPDKLAALSVGVKQVVTTDGAFVALRSNGTVLPWGNVIRGGTMPAEQAADVVDVGEVFANEHAFAAVVYQVSVSCWGDASHCQDVPEVTTSFNASGEFVQTTSAAFALLTAAGGIVTWGDPAFGGSLGAGGSTDYFGGGINYVVANEGAFAALLVNGTVVVWGSATHGGDMAYLPDMQDVRSISATCCAFAALLGNGDIVTWGNPQYGGTQSSIPGNKWVKLAASRYDFIAWSRFRNIVLWGSSIHEAQKDWGPLGWVTEPSELQQYSVVEVVANEGAYAALTTRGGVITWGRASHGGRSDDVKTVISSGVKSVHATACAFAALRYNGDVFPWGCSEGGGIISAFFQILLSNVKQVIARNMIFAAVTSSGSLLYWGRLSGQYNGPVRSVVLNNFAVAAIDEGGAVVAWGDADYGGSIDTVASSLSSGVVSLYATCCAFAALTVDGSIVRWGSHAHGGGSSEAEDPGSYFSHVFASEHAFVGLSMTVPLVSPTPSPSVTPSFSPSSSPTPSPSSSPAPSYSSSFSPSISPSASPKLGDSMYKDIHLSQYDLKGKHTVIPYQGDCRQSLCVLLGETTATGPLVPLGDSCGLSDSLSSSLQRVMSTTKTHQSREQASTAIPHQLHCSDTFTAANITLWQLPSSLIVDGDLRRVTNAVAPVVVGQSIVAALNGEEIIHLRCPLCQVNTASSHHPDHPEHLGLSVKFGNWLAQQSSRSCTKNITISPIPANITISPGALIVRVPPVEALLGLCSCGVPSTALPSECSVVLNLHLESVIYAPLRRSQVSVTHRLQFPKDGMAEGGVFTALRTCQGFTEGAACLEPDTATQCAFGSSPHCRSCPANAFCPGGSRAWPMPGYWTAGEDTAMIYECPQPSRERCPGWSTSTQTSECGEGYDPTVPLCGACASGFYSRDGQCVACPAPGAATVPGITPLGAIGIVAGTLGGVFVVIAGSLTAGFRASKLPVSKVLGVRVAGDFMLWLVTTLQVFLQLTRVPVPGLPQFLRNLFSFFQLLETDITGIVPIGCVDTSPFLYGNIVSGVCTGATILFIALGVRVYREFKTKAKLRLMAGRSKSRGPHCCLNWVLYSCFMAAALTYSVVLEKSMTTVSCSTVVREVVTNSGSLEKQEALVWSLNTRITCYEGEHLVSAIIAWTALLVVGLGLPVAVTCFSCSRVKYRLRSINGVPREHSWQPVPPPPPPPPPPPLPEDNTASEPLPAAPVQENRPPLQPDSSMYIKQKLALWGSSTYWRLHESDHEVLRAERPWAPIFGFGQPWLRSTSLVAVLIVTLVSQLLPSEKFPELRLGVLVGFLGLLAVFLAWPSVVVDHRWSTWKKLPRAMVYLTTAALVVLQSLITLDLASQASPGLGETKQEGSAVLISFATQILAWVLFGLTCFLPVLLIFSLGVWFFRLVPCSLCCACCCCGSASKARAKALVEFLSSQPSETQMRRMARDYDVDRIVSALTSDNPQKALQELPPRPSLRQSSSNLHRSMKMLRKAVMKTGNTAGDGPVMLDNPLTAALRKHASSLQGKQRNPAFQQKASSSLAASTMAGEGHQPQSQASSAQSSPSLSPSASPRLGPRRSSRSLRRKSQRSSEAAVSQNPLFQLLQQQREQAHTAALSSATDPAAVPADRSAYGFLHSYNAAARYKDDGPHPLSPAGHGAQGPPGLASGYEGEYDDAGREYEHDESLLWAIDSSDEESGTGGGSSRGSRRFLRRMGSRKTIEVKSVDASELERRLVRRRPTGIDIAKRLKMYTSDLAQRFGRRVVVSSRG